MIASCGGFWGAVAGLVVLFVLVFVGSAAIVGVRDAMRQRR